MNQIITELKGILADYMVMAITQKNGLNQNTVKGRWFLGSCYVTDGARIFKADLGKKDINKVYNSFMEDYKKEIHNGKCHDESMLNAFCNNIRGFYNKELKGKYIKVYMDGEAVEHFTNNGIPFCKTLNGSRSKYYYYLNYSREKLITLLMMTA